MRKTALLLSILLSVTLLVSAAQTAFAKHNKSGGKSPTVSASRAKNKLSVLAAFSNLASVKSISYNLTYDSARGPQGAGGTISKVKGSELSRRLLLGTCSGKVCTYHKDVGNIKLSVDFTLKSGGVISYEKNIK